MPLGATTRPRPRGRGGGVGGPAGHTAAPKKLQGQWRAGWNEEAVEERRIPLHPPPSCKQASARPAAGMGVGGRRVVLGTPPTRLPGHKEDETGDGVLRRGVGAPWAWPGGPLPLHPEASLRSLRCCRKGPKASSSTPLGPAFFRSVLPSQDKWANTLHSCCAVVGLWFLCCGGLGFALWGGGGGLPPSLSVASMLKRIQKAVREEGLDPGKLV